MELIETKDYKKEIKIVEKYRYMEHKNCDICLTKEYCKMNPYCYGCALTEDGKWIGFIK